MVCVYEYWWKYPYLYFLTTIMVIGWRERCLPVLANLLPVELNKIDIVSGMVLAVSSKAVSSRSGPGWEHKIFAPFS